MRRLRDPLMPPGMASAIVADVKRWGVWIAVGVVAVILVTLGWLGYGQAKQFEALARSGRADASAALKSLQREDDAAALASFQKAEDEFTRARGLLGPDWLRGVPWVGRQLSAADGLVSIGAEGSSAGAHAAALLGGAGTAGGGDRLGQLMSTAQPHLDAALVSMVAIHEQAAGLTTDGLVPQLADAVTELQGLLRPLELVLGRSQALLDLERYLYSADHRFLVLAQNNAQLRPSGGFPGTYGLVTIGPSGFRLEKFEDVYALPGARSDLAVPQGMGTKRVHFHLANWWIDFPTTARTMVQLWDGMTPRQPQIDGVIAIDLPTIRSLLEVFGPVTVPKVKGPLTADNVFERLSYAVEIDGKGGYDANGKKAAVVLLAKAVMERLLSLPEDEFVPVMSALATSANEKHVQVFLTDPATQSAMVAAGWSGAIAPSEDTTDLIAVANAVTRRPAKGNLGVTKGLDYTVGLNADGSAETTLALSYKKSSRNALGSLQDKFWDYLRVNRATGTTLQGGKGIDTIDDATGLPTFSHYFGLDSGKSTTVTMKNGVPGALRRSADGTWHYRLLIAKQADLVNTDARVTVKIPDGWQVDGSTAWFRVSGAAVPVTADGTTVSLRTALKQDLVLDLVLSRP